jgi:hypothetical protein
LVGKRLLLGKKIPNGILEDYLARLTINQRQLQLRVQILRIFSAVSLTGALLRSRSLTAEQAIDGVPDALKPLARMEFFAMVDEHLIWAPPAYPSGYYILNPNKRDIIKLYLTGKIVIRAPLEEFIPDGFEEEYAFKTRGAKDSKGVIGTYYYYRSKQDRYHYIVLIETSASEKPEKKDLGSLGMKDSVLSIVLEAVNRLEKDCFIKADLEPLISDKRIVQNRQPVKAAIDVLEYLGYVKKTGKRSGKSEEYERTDKQPVDESLTKYGFPDDKDNDDKST